MKTALFILSVLFTAMIVFYINLNSDCDSLYNKLNKMSVESSLERLEAENLYFEACQK